MVIEKEELRFIIIPSGTSLNSLVNMLSYIYSRKCFSFIFGMVGEVVRDTAESRPGLVLMIQQVPDGGFPIVNKRLSSSYGSSR